jgi:hypothetical protein
MIKFVNCAGTEVINLYFLLLSVSTQIRSYHAGNVEVPDFSYYR